MTDFVAASGGEGGCEERGKGEVVRTRLDHEGYDRRLTSSSSIKENAEDESGSDSQHRGQGSDRALLEEHGRCCGMEAALLGGQIRGW